MAGNLDVADLKAYVEQGEIDTVLVCFPDMQGRLIGKRVTGRFFLDKCIDEMPFVVAKPVVDCPEPEYVPQPKFVPLDDTHLGDTIYNSTEEEIAGLALQPDAGVRIVDGYIVVSCDELTPA